MIFVSHPKSFQGQSLSFYKPLFALFNRFSILMTRLLVTRAVRTPAFARQAQRDLRRPRYARRIQVNLFFVDFPFDGMNSGYHTEIVLS